MVNSLHETEVTLILPFIGEIPLRKGVWTLHAIVIMSRITHTKNSRTEPATPALVIFL